MHKIGLCRPKPVVLSTYRYIVLVREDDTPNPTMASQNDTLEAELTEDNDGFCTLQIQSKRGGGTRDEDRVKATLGRPTLEEVEQDRKAFLSMVEETMDARRTANHDSEESDD
jgi:hypothetical protein